MARTEIAELIKPPAQRFVRILPSSTFSPRLDAKEGSEGRRKSGMPEV
jgi:hypothetical protein